MKDKSNIKPIVLGLAMTFEMKEHVGRQSYLKDESMSKYVRRLIEEDMEKKEKSE